MNVSFSPSLSEKLRDFKQENSFGLFHDNFLKQNNFSGRPKIFLTHSLLYFLRNIQVSLGKALELMLTISSPSAFLS